MAGTLHQGILSLFCEDPWLAFDILGLERPTKATPIDRRNDVEGEHKDAKTVDLGFPDLVLTSREIGDPTRGVVICVEAQGGRDANKRYSIPFYHGALANRHKLPTWAVVVSFSPGFSSDLAVWSKGPPPRVDVLVLDADSVPMPATLAEARARPTLAVLAAALHGRRGNMAAARLGIAAVQNLPEQTRLAYRRIILAAVSEPRRKVLEQELPVEERFKLWEIERESSPYVYGVREGRKQGREQGRRETLVELIIALLEVRGVQLDEVSAARVRGCDELSTLQRWASRAREVATVAELFMLQ